VSAALGAWSTSVEGTPILFSDRERAVLLAE